MLNQSDHDLWLMEEEPLVEEQADLFRTMPEFRQLSSPERRDDELGLRSVLERPEVLSKAWRRGAPPCPRPPVAKLPRRQPQALRAA